MKYFATIFWAVIVLTVVSYVLTSMGGQAFNLASAISVAAVFAIAAIVLGDGILKEDE
ncbi:hypothetical protein JCM21714_2696 [Gracilibacillus boraciitolerans JCM 21714]|uniref:DUF2929 domain-containing protein n=1 Tax=Gracilibacillus boraciitolerans JCM 21714 TaxID=1298598 RepID=W4VL87_9BACI|nr:DUF2929 family protein [Gracilibacillus boraciitolerans]GAE93598.1 hypothetical protein JCM21714_2696 [Gracilibacillus boraciitolerans JCM 21714]